MTCLKWIIFLFRCYRSPPSFCPSLQIEDIVTCIQDETEGVPIRTVKSFMTKIPSVVTGKKYIYTVEN